MSDDVERNRNVLALLWGELRTLAEPVLGSYDPWRRARLMRALGWDLEAISGVDAHTFEAWVGTVGTAVDTLDAAIAGGRPDSLAELKKIGTAAGTAFGQVGALPPAVRGKLPAVDGLPEALADDLVDHLILTYLLRRAPWAVPLLTLLGLVTPGAELPPNPPMPAGDAPIRLPRHRDELHLERLVELVADPGGYLKGLYAPAGWDTPEAVEALAARLLPRLAATLRAFGVDAAHGVRPGIGPDQGEAGLRLADGLLRVRFAVAGPPGGGEPAALAGQPGPRALAGPADGDPDAQLRLGVTLALACWDGLLTGIVAPTGEAHLEGAFGRWNVATDLAGAGPAIAINSAGVTVAGGGPAVKFSAEVARIAPKDQPGWVIGAPDGTHLAIGQLVLRGRATLGTGRDDIELMLAAGRAELVVKAGDGDGLLARLLPADGLRFGFDLGLGWSLRTGLHLSGAAALTADYPMHLSLRGVHLEGLRIALAASTHTASVGLTVTTTVRAEIGPLHAVVENIGIRADLTFPPALPAGTGNLGGADLVPRFKAPDGVGLRIDNGFVNGGGYLFVDEPRGMYAGALQLGIAAKDGLSPMRGFLLQATAILNTRNPDGSRLAEADGEHTFSMLVVGTFQWYPGLMLFWGISITGLGLVVGHNRRSNPEEVRNAARAGTLDSLLFPEDVVGRAPAVIATLSRIFPVDPTGTVLGAMVRLNFLSGQIVADLAVLVEFPDPVRVLLLGKLVVDFRPAGRLRLDSVGIVDVARKEISLDAALIDSNLFGQPVSGEMALRARWGGDKSFAMSIGGFHPRYCPPAGFPSLKRFEIKLLKLGKGIKLNAYLAVTSNTAQFGAELLMKFEAAGFVLDGRAWLDVLFQFKPFWFTAEIGAYVALTYDGTELLVIRLFIGVSGPGPWRAWGEARIKFLWWEVSAKLDWTDGKKNDQPEPSYVDAADLLQQALSTPDAWAVRATAVGAEPVALRAVEDTGGALLLSPGAALGVRQNVLPLGVELRRIGTSRLRGPNRFTLTEVSAGTGDDAARGTLGEAILDDFAPGQFRDLTPEERMLTPGFERLEAGREVALPDRTTLPAGDDTVFAGLDGDGAYDRVIVDDPDDAGREMPAAAPTLSAADAVPGGLLALFAATGPAANARTRSSGAARFAGAGLGLRDAGPSWVAGRGAPRPAGRRGRPALARLRPPVAALPTATQAAEVAPGGDRGRLIRRASVPVPTPTIVLPEPEKVS
ncbi:hypothetical protein OOK41_15960 [Micromonospora sp. NBC_01655]|uniref:DUF6603 domain-containing protein n=1 Tax=Micromonospora sp. NBC_01655 TaxID=2975983 RepID=UPI0022591C86|nr:DUF6603 domain-containing protein [Micromonospora sp. NBC_01655]MCX4471783.1 hypothetical protein [Micromonospora sp. NBC_01655]